MSEKITPLNEDLLVEASLEELEQKLEFGASPTCCDGLRVGS